MNKQASEQQFKVAAVQWAPVFHDLEAGLKKAAEAISEAAAAGARLVVFPEVWLQGYPYWASISTRDPVFGEWYRLLKQNAAEIPGPEIERLAAVAGSAGINVAISLHERAGETLYNTMVYLSASGELLGAHRKLMPTVTERLVWGMGDGSDLAAYETSAGRLGGLLCFEHQMAPARYLLANLGTQVHAASWPGFAFLDGVIDASTRQLAHENGCFVVVAREVMSMDRVGSDCPPDPSGDAGRWEAHGGSAIIAPDGRYLAGPVFGEETIVTAEIDLGLIADAKGMFDTAGHYARPDVFQLVWHSQAKPAMLKSTEDDPAL